MPSNIKLPLLCQLPPADIDFYQMTMLKILGVLEYFICVYKLNLSSSLRRSSRVVHLLPNPLEYKAAINHPHCLEKDTESPEHLVCKTSRRNTKGKLVDPSSLDNESFYLT